MESKNDYMDRFIKEVVSKGVEGLLPQNLTQEWLDILLEEANHLEPDSDQDFPKNLFLAVIKILFHHKGYPDKIEVTDEELFEYIEKYTIALAGEDIARKTDIDIEPPTLNNVLSDDRKITAYKR